MGMFKMMRGVGGRRTMSKYATPEEGKNLAKEEAKEEAKASKAPEVAPLNLEPFIGSSAFNALRDGIHKQGISWAQKYIEKLTSVDEIHRLRGIEQHHPKHYGGRKGVMSALQLREDLLTQPEGESPLPAEVPEAPEEEEVSEQEEEPSQRFICPECNFACGSEEGLDAHINAVHDL